MFCNLMTDQCIILAGGVGSRLGKITKKTPKPLINVNNRPFINYIIKTYRIYFKILQSMKNIYMTVNCIHFIVIYPKRNTE